MCRHTNENGYVKEIVEIAPVGLDSFNLTMDVEICHSCFPEHRKTQRVSGLMHSPDVTLGKPSHRPLEEIVVPRLNGYNFVHFEEDRFGGKRKMVRIEVAGMLLNSGDVTGGTWNDSFLIPLDEFLTPKKEKVQA